MRLTIHGRPMSKKNCYAVYRGRLTHTDEFKAWEDDAVIQLKAQANKRGFDKGVPVCVAFVAYCGKGTQPDIDNVAGSVLDALQLAEIIPNDRDVKKLIATKESDKKNPRVEIILNAI